MLATTQCPLTKTRLFTFDPRANDRDDDTLTITAVTQGTYGTVTTNGTTITYTPSDTLAADETATDTFTYTVSDATSPWHLHGVLGFFSRGHTDTATVTVTVTGVNDPPTAVADAVPDPIGEDAGSTGTNVLANDTDPDRGDTKTIATFTQGTYGNETDNGDGILSYTPDDRADALAAGETQTDRFTYTIKDGSGATSTATVSVVLSGANDAPAAKDDIVTDPIGELDGPKVIDVLANDTDPDRGDTKTITGVTSGVYGDVVIRGGTVTYTPNAAAQALVAGDVKDDSFTYTVADGSGATSRATVSLRVAGVNNATVLRTDGTPVDVELGPDGDIGWIRNADGTLTQVDWSEDEGWSVGAGVAVDIDAGALDVGYRYGYAYDQQDDSLAKVDLETGSEVGRAFDVKTGLRYDFGDVTDVTVYSDPSGTDDRLYAVNQDGTVWAIDAQTMEVIGRVETEPLAVASANMLVADATVARTAPTLAVSADGSRLYVANGSKVSVVNTRRTAVA
jgi:VCBS repeat-containing protein